MANWKVVRPSAFNNRVNNPSAEDATSSGHAGGSGDTLSASTEQSLFGAYSFKVATGGTDTTMFDTTLTSNLADAQQYASVWVYLPSGWDGGALTLGITSFASGVVDDSTNGSTSTEGEWVKLWILFTPDSGDLTGIVRVTSASIATAAQNVYFDGVMVGKASLEQTYVDGDQPGCYWLGAVRSSKSKRIATDRRGGDILDMTDDLYYVVSGEVGTGMVNIQNSSNPVTLQGGALYNNARIDSRNVVLNGSFNVGQAYGSSLTNFHSRRQALLKLFYTRTSSNINETPLPVLMYYTGGADNKELSVYYDGGLNDGPAAAGVSDNEQLRLFAPDPFFYGVGRPGALLDTNDSLTFRMLGKRTGLPQDIGATIWENMGPPGAPGTAVYTSIFALAEDDEYIYIGGDFTNFDNTANSDYIVRWHKEDEAYSALGTGTSDIVNTIFVHPDGDVYAGGQFVTAGGVTCRGVARWDGTNWNALGPPSAPALPIVHSIALGADGLIYVGHENLNWDGDASQDYISSWDGTSWASLGTGLNGACWVVTSYLGFIYAGGEFTTAGGTGVSKIAQWDVDAGSWAVVHTSTIAGGAGAVTELVFDADGNFYIGGSFATIDSDGDFSYVAFFNGQTFIAMDGGANNTVESIVLDNNGRLHVGGDFTSIGSLGALGQKYAVWNGATWVRGDIDYASTPNVEALHLGRNGDLYMSFAAAGIGTGTFSGLATVTYTASAEAYPIIDIKRSGGTSAKVIAIRNETTNADLWFNYDLRDGETLTIRLNPFEGIEVASSIGTNAASGLLQNSDVGAFFLDAGNVSTSRDNIITAYVNEVGGPTITSTLYWRNAYLSQD